MTQNNPTQKLVAEWIEEKVSKMPVKTQGTATLVVQSFLKFIEDRGIELTLTPEELSRRQPTHNGYIPGISPE